MRADLRITVLHADTREPVAGFCHIHDHEPTDATDQACDTDDPLSAMTLYATVGDDKSAYQAEEDGDGVTLHFDLPVGPATVHTTNVPDGFLTPESVDVVLEPGLNDLVILVEPADPEPSRSVIGVPSTGGEPSRSARPDSSVAPSVAPSASADPSDPNAVESGTDGDDDASSGDDTSSEPSASDGGTILGLPDTGSGPGSMTGLLSIFALVAAAAAAAVIAIRRRRPSGV